MKQNEIRLNADVVIVGAGPVGLAMSLLLARQGVPSLIVEKFKTRHGAPKAHALNPRSLEICQSIGLDVAAMAAKAAPPEDGGWVRFVTNLTGREIGVLPYERQDQAVKELTPTPLINLAQPDFEDFLLEEVIRCPLIELRRGLEWKSCEQTAGVVTSRIRDVDQDGDFSLNSRYLIAADGAGSAVRAGLGIPMCGDGTGQAFITIHFSANLRPLVKDRPGILYWIMQPPHAGVLIAYRIENNWCMLYPYDPKVTPREHFTEEVCTGILESAFGVDGVDVSIKHILPWMMMSEVAERYRAGNVFLVGDAAHRFPPTGGLGLNTGIQDAHNLAWKIAAVRNWAADPQFLDSYEQERKAVAVTNSAQSKKNALRILGLQNSLRTDSLSKFSSLEQLLDDPDATAEVKRNVEEQREHFDSLALQLGFVYGGEKSDIENISDFVPAAVEGARLPHAWVTKEGRRVSTLELLDPKGFTLLTSSQSASQAAVFGIRAPIMTVVAGRDFEDIAGGFDRVAGLSTGRSLLVRPDGHIAAVLTNETLSDAGKIVSVLLKARKEEVAA